MDNQEAKQEESLSGWLDSSNELWKKVSESDFNPSVPIFLRPAWFRLFDQHVNEAGNTRWLYLDQQSRSPLVLGLLDRTERYWGIKTKSMNGLSNFYSPMFDIFGGHSTEADCHQLLACGRERLVGSDCINFLPLLEKQARYWAVAFEELGFSSHIYHHSVNWFHENIRDLDHYWAQRPSRLRNTLKRKQDKLSRSGEYTTRIFSQGSRAELIQCLIDYHQVYCHSWKKPEPWPAFIDAVAEYECQQGELRLGILYHREQPVAAQIRFINGDTAYIYKLAHHIDYTPQSVGTVLSASMFEQAIDGDGVSRVDFLTGDDRYKQDWMQSSRPLYGIQACNRHTFMGKVMASINRLSRLKKRSPRE